MEVRRLLAAPLMLTVLLAAGPATAPRVAGFAAYLLNSRTGQMSPDVMTNPDLLGNVPAGPMSSVSTLVVVRIAFGPEAAVPDGAHVHLLATQAGQRGIKARVVLDRSARLGPIAADGTTHVGFWLDDTGCTRITLRARLLSGRAGKEMARGQADLPFACYD